MTTAASEGAERPAEILDVLIVGGGPAGTAAAFRASELDLTTLVIDYDDLMKRIRDYSKDKLILPGFGGGDAMRFPQGGELVASLVFDDIDKDELCAAWKGCYRRFGVGFETGVELLGIEREEGGLWRARSWDHRARTEVSHRARTLVLALGRGVPRRFDIPGDTDGIAYRLSAPRDYVGAPACVIGGGTSAAEAVIAISNAKAAAGDPCGVYWSYRGDRMPRVSRALAEVFFEAYVGNGNIRYYPKSEPAAVVTGFDRQEYLAIRVDRRILDGRPHEALHLEFHKGRCVACIGEDLPEQLLASMGILLVTGGPQAKKRMVVNRYLESRRPGVYVIGDLLSQAYLEADDFDGDPAGFREIRHRGNIKSALRDGVRVAQIIRQRLDGATEVDVGIAEVEEGPRRRASLAAARPARDGPPPASVAPERALTEAEATLVRVLPTGVEAEEYPVRRHGVTTIGSSGCDLTFASDSMLAPRHCSISHTEDGYFLRDDGSDTGLFLKIPPARKRALAAGDLLRVGRQFLRVSGERGRFALTHYDRHGHELGRHPIGDQVTIVGRQSPGLTLASEDGTLSRRHLALSVEDGELHVKDLKSVNGTYLRVRAALELEHGDQFRAGQQVLTFSRDLEQALDAGYLPRAGAPAVRVAEPEAPAPSPGAAATVTLRGSGETLTMRPHETVCEALERHGLAIVAECHAGICGSDPVRLHSGRASALSEPGAQERETLEDLCGLEPGPCRLACMLRLQGPAEIEIL